MRAILFPGQGSQYVGMGSIFYEKYDLVKEIFNTVDETLNYPLSKIILKGPEEELKLTKRILNFPIRQLCTRNVYPREPF